MEKCEQHGVKEGRRPIFFSRFFFSLGRNGWPEVSRVNIYTYIYINIYIHTHIYIYRSIYLSLSLYRPCISPALPLETHLGDLSRQYVVGRLDVAGSGARERRHLREHNEVRRDENHPEREAEGRGRRSHEYGVEGELLQVRVVDRLERLSAEGRDCRARDQHRLRAAAAALSSPGNQPRRYERPGVCACSVARPSGFRVNPSAVQRTAANIRTRLTWVLSWFNHSTRARI